MPIPKHHEIRIPAMKLLRDSEKSLKLRAFELPLSKHFKLTDEELFLMYSSGNGPIFYDRISWALSYLNLAGLVQKPKRGSYELSKKGIELLASPEKINAYIKKEVERKEPKEKKSNTTEIRDDTNPSLTPREKLEASFSRIKKTIYAEILDTILGKSPQAFEKIVVELLQKMGYGGEIKNSGIVTQSTNDKGIDGIIKEDILGLGRIYIQAKRYSRENSVGRQEIQKFVGALAVAQSNKGVFITTSYYTKGGIEYANSLNGSTNLVLIDGPQLAEYIYEFNLGMQTKKVIKLKEIDSDYWDRLQDN